MESNGYLIRLLAGMFLLCAWLNLKEGYIDKLIDYIKKREHLGASIINCLIISSPLALYYFFNFSTKSLTMDEQNLKSIELGWRIMASIATIIAAITAFIQLRLKNRRQKSSVSNRWK